jgi:hypothetical protein
MEADRVIAHRDVPKPDVRELRACGLAALAEAGVLALPAHLILTESSDLRIGIWTFVLPFIVAFVAGTILVCRFRSSPNAPIVAAVGSVLLGLRFGWGPDLNLLVFVVVVSLLVTIRMVTLALRDWRTPYHAEFGWLSVVLGAEVLVASGPQQNWKPALVVVAPLFFVAALASRATTVWTAGTAGELDERVRVAWVRRALLVTGGLVAAMAGAVLLGIRGGLFDRLGAALAPVGAALASFMAWSFAQLARPIFWLVDLLHIDPDAVRRFFERLQANAQRAGRQAQHPGPPGLWQRLLGLAVFALVAVLLVRVIRRFLPEAGPGESPSSPGATVTTADLPADSERSARGPAFRRELPADRVRRWYAEILLELERLRMPKDPALTPAEFVPGFTGAFPDSAEGFRALTHAYEDVRYGSLSLDEGELRGLERQARSVMGTLRHAKPPPEPDEAAPTDV